MQSDMTHALGAASCEKMVAIPLSLSAIQMGPMCFAYAITTGHSAITLTPLKSCLPLSWPSFATEASWIFSWIAWARFSTPGVVLASDILLQTDNGIDRTSWVEGHFGMDCVPTDLLICLTLMARCTAQVASCFWTLQKQCLSGTWTR